MSRQYGREYTEAVDYLTKKHNYDDRNIITRIITYESYIGNKRRKEMAVQLDFMIYVVCKFAPRIAPIIESGIREDELSPIKKEVPAADSKWPRSSNVAASPGFSRRPREPAAVAAPAAPVRFCFLEPLISLGKVLELNECNTYQKILAKLSEPGYFG
jgi:hypothetical protein